MNPFKEYWKIFKELQSEQRQEIEIYDTKITEEENRQYFPFFETCIVYILNDLYNLPWWFLFGLLAWLFYKWYRATTIFLRVIIDFYKK